MSDQNLPIEQIVELTQTVAILLEDFKAQATSNASNANESIAQLTSLLSKTQHEIDVLIKNTGTVIQKETSKSADEALTSIEKRMDYLCDNIENSTKKIVNASGSISRQAKFYGWGILGALGIAAISVVIFSSWYALDKKKSIDLLIKDYENIQYSAHVKSAIEKVTFTVCGDKACVKLDEKAQRYGKDGEYVIVE